MRILHLPFPPSVNRLWRFNGPLAVGRPDRRKRDIDNINKATLDLLEHVGVLENDHYVHDLRSYWSDKVVGIQVIIKNLESTAASRALID